jgi:ankyrin repeat protein
LGVETEARNKYGDTALLRAIKLGSEEVWAALLSTENGLRGAKINARHNVYTQATRLRQPI